MSEYLYDSIESIYFALLSYTILELFKDSFLLLVGEFIMLSLDIIQI